MKVHHLNCGSMDVPGSPLICHVLLLEARDGLVLVDSGFGLADIAEPAARIGWFRRMIRPRLDPAETAIRQIEALGHSAADVRHIIVTHMDLDHIGGISDFPDAQVHLTSAEALGSVHSPSRREQMRYRSIQWSHGPNLVEHDPSGEMWNGFAAAKPLGMIDDDVVLVSLPGHTRGHACIAVKTTGDGGAGDGGEGEGGGRNGGDGWILHAGDAFYHHAQIDGSGKAPFGLRAMETMVAFNVKQVRANHERLSELHHRNQPGVRVVSAHDPHYLP